MDPSGNKVREDWLFRLANAQFGLLRYDQLRAVLSPTQIRRRAADRRLTRLGAQVYCLGHTALRRQGSWLAAQWACPGCTLSHVTAARFHGWALDAPDDTVHLSTTGANCSRTGVVVHRTRHLDAVDVLDAHPLRVTHVPRTLVDLADVLPWPSYRAVADGLPHLRTDTIRSRPRTT